FELVITAVPFLGIWALMWTVVAHGHWIGLLLAAPAAGLLVRLFMIQHDCGHGSFFHGRLANDWVGRAIGVVTLTPYDYWRRNHARHHASSGNLDDDRRPRRDERKEKHQHPVSPLRAFSSFRTLQGRLSWYRPLESATVLIRPR